MQRVEIEISLPTDHTKRHGIRFITTLDGEEITIVSIANPRTAITLSRNMAAALVVGLKRLIDDTGNLSMLVHEQDTSDPDVRNEIDEICARLGATIDWGDE